MSNTWFVSDTHFHHKNILNYAPGRISALAQYCSRRKLLPEAPGDIENRIVEMVNSDDAATRDQILHYHDQMIIDNWNAVVKPNDTVWFLGDLCLGKQEFAAEIVAKLNGHKRMVRGNHDRWSDDFYRSLGFEFVSKYPVVLKGKFVLSHAPLEAAAESSNMFYIYGHVHDKECFLVNKSNCKCVCLEVNDFKPVRISSYDKAQ